MFWAWSLNLCNASSSSTHLACHSDSVLGLGWSSSRSSTSGQSMSCSSASSRVSKSAFIVGQESDKTEFAEGVDSAWDDMDILGPIVCKTFLHLSWWLSQNLTYYAFKIGNFSAPNQSESLGYKISLIFCTKLFKNPCIRLLWLKEPLSEAKTFYRIGPCCRKVSSIAEVGPNRDQAAVRWRLLYPRPHPPPLLQTDFRNQSFRGWWRHRRHSAGRIWSRSIFSAPVSASKPRSHLTGRSTCSTRTLASAAVLAASEMT